MLCWRGYQLLPCARVCVYMGLCLSQVRVLSRGIYGLVNYFSVEASFDQSYTVLKGNSGIYQNKGTSLWNSAQNSGLKKISPQRVDRRMCCQLSSAKVDAQSVVNWTVVYQLS